MSAVNRDAKALLIRRKTGIAHQHLLQPPGRDEKGTSYKELMLSRPQRAGCQMRCAIPKFRPQDPHGGLHQLFGRSSGLRGRDGLLRDFRSHRTLR